MCLYLFSNSIHSNPANRNGTSGKSIAFCCVFINILPCFCNRISMIATGHFIAGISATAEEFLQQLCLSLRRTATAFGFTATKKDPLQPNRLQQILTCCQCPSIHIYLQKPIQVSNYFRPCV